MTTTVNPPDPLPPPNAPVTDITQTTRCVNCGADLGGPYCGECGQRVLVGRHTLRGLTRAGLDRVFDLERGLSHTVVRLSLEPGTAVREYLRGRTVAYVHPAAYLVLAMAAFALTMAGLGGTGGPDDRVFWGGLVVFLAAASRVVFRRERLNYAEHLIISVYLYAHAVLVFTAALVLVWLAPEAASAVVAGVGLAGAVAYMVWGYAAAFSATPGSRLAHLRSWLGSALVVGLGALAWAALLAIFIQAMRY